MPGSQPASPSSAATKTSPDCPRRERIRYRLVGADCRYHANDNIAAFIEPGELEELKAEVRGEDAGACWTRW